MPRPPLELHHAFWAALGAELTAPTAAALTFRVTRGRWPWAVVTFDRRQRDRIRAELERAGLLLGCTLDPAGIRAAAAVGMALHREVTP